MRILFVISKQLMCYYGYFPSKKKENKFQSHLKFIIEQLKQTQAFKQFQNARRDVKRALWSCYTHKHIYIYICLEKIIVSCNALKKIFF